MIKVTHQVLGGGHFVTGEDDQRVLTIGTNNGTPADVRAWADGEAARVAAMTRRIEFARQMAHQMEQER